MRVGSRAIIFPSFFLFFSFFLLRGGHSHKQGMAPERLKDAIVGILNFPLQILDLLEKRVWEQLERSLLENVT
jgi:hypothetical protein